MIAKEDKVALSKLISALWKRQKVKNNDSY